MARDRRRPTQPPDETPLIPPPLTDGTPAPRDDPPAAPVAPVPPENPAVRATIDRVAAQLVGGMDQLDAGVRQTIDGTRTALDRAKKSVDKQIKGVLMDVDTRLSAASRDLADAGVPISYSPGERAAELADQTGAALIDRVSRTAQLGDDQGGAELPREAAPVFGPQSRGVEGTVASAGGPPPPVPTVPLGITPPIGSAEYLSMMEVPDSGSPPYRPGTGFENVPTPEQEPFELPLPPPPLPIPPPPPPPPIPDPIPPVGPCVAIWTGTIWAPGGAVGAGDPRWRNWVPPQRPGAYPNETVTVPCPPPLPLPPPPPPPTVPPIPPDLRCGVEEFAYWNGTAWECRPTPAEGGGGGTPGGGQCCPPQEITVVSPPVTVTYPPPPPAATVRPATIGLTDPGVAAVAVDWDDPLACTSAGVLASTVPPPAGRPPDPGILTLWLKPGEAGAIGDLLQMPGLNGLVPGAMKAATQLGDAAATFFTTQIAGGAAADYLLKSPAAKRSKDWATTTTLMTTLALAGLAENTTHAPVTYLFQSDVYRLQFLNPQYLPTQPEIDALYLTDRIDSEVWECWTKANGNLPRPAKLVRDSKRTIPGVTDVVSLARRKVISFTSDLPKRLRELGVTDPGHVAEFWKLSEFVPPFTDVMRMMVRDSEDRQVVDKYDYDKGFEAKFAGKLAQWAEDQGISTDVARYLWRAHWDLPSNTALYEMFHRLRPDRPEVREWDLAWGRENFDPQWRVANPRPPVVTLDDVRYAIEVNDMSPAWVDPLLAVSYRPITPTDARRMFEIGDANEDELYHRLRDSGYDDPSARRLVKYETALRSRRVANQTGTLSTRKVMTAYREGLLDEREADQLLTPHFPDADVRRQTILRATTERLLETRRVQVRMLVKQYVYGEIDGLGLDTQLGGIGILGQERLTVIQRANAARSGHLKEVRVQYVLDMLQRGIVTVDQAADRLDRLGYSAEDTARMIALAGAISTERQAARAIRASEKARAEARRQKSDALRDLDRLRAERERQVKAMEAYLEDLKERAAALGGTGPPP